MDNLTSPPSSRFPRVLVIGIAGVLVLLGLIFVWRLTSQPALTTRDERPDALASSN